MRVTFTKADGRRYTVAIEREHGPRLVPRAAPGYDDLMPHDLAHYLVEEQMGIRLGVFGQLAAGGGGMFAPAPADRSETERRRVRRVATAGRADMRRSESAVGLCMATWHARTGRATLPHAVDPDVVTSDELDRVVRRIDEVAARWHALTPGGSLSFEWPRSATADPRALVSGSRSAPTRRRAPR